MRWVDEFRDPGAARTLLEAIHATASRPYRIMEVCGGQTHAIARHGLEQLLPAEVELLHGPGCPVCVTPEALVDAAIELSLSPDVCLHTYPDMLRVPGSRGDLLGARAAGGDVRGVRSPLDALEAARDETEKEHVFFAVGFETTAPATATAIALAARERIERFSVLSAHVRVPPAMEAVLAAEGSAIDGFLAAGHVCTITGIDGYPELAERFGVPIVVTGFEPVDILSGLLRCVEMLESNAIGVESRYARVARASGNRRAQEAIAEVFEAIDLPFRGLGVLPRGGLGIRPTHRAFDARARFGLRAHAEERPSPCRAADVLRGRLKPPECPEFGSGCTPDRPLGAPMVSTEGACAAYHRYRRLGRAERPA